MPVVRRTRHLGGRFFGSLRAVPVDDGDRSWVGSVLTPAELGVWNELGRADQTESVAVGRRFVAASAPAAPDAYVAAALLHDVGKIDSGLGTFGRALAAVVGGVSGHGRARRNCSNRIGRYIAHDDLGAARLAAAGARPEPVAWARAHHRTELWAATGIPPGVCAALAIADGE